MILIPENKGIKLKGIDVENGEEIKINQPESCVKKLYVFLKDYNIKTYLATEKFFDVLRELNLDGYWGNRISKCWNGNPFAPKIQNMRELVVEDIFIDLLYDELSKDKSNFVQKFDHIVNMLISDYFIQNFDTNKLKKRMLECGFSTEDINQMKCLGYNKDIQDFTEMVDQIPSPEVLPDGIDKNKYNEILEQARLPITLYKYIFVCENILRKFIIQVLNDNGYPSIDSIGLKNLSETIKNQKEQEALQNYLPIRGDHDIYYLDLIDLNKILTYEDTWKKCFKDKIQTQTFITERINSLYKLRNRVAHCSAYLTIDELKSIETYCREIIKSIDKYIK